ncbi:glycosyltransferase family 2 protein [Alphaproteobacteria bacterium]|nr:glycosyltransferase family 2 protein [Alphaproteobacteria bacterium]
MKLIIQIPCLNEEGSLPVALAALPRDVEGFDRVEWLVIDDGSTDKTVEVAKAHGVDHVVILPYNQGLAKAFTAGLLESAKLGADVVVNTDADNQYDASFIPALTAPILANETDMVIGARPINSVKHFSPMKKLLQNLGSAVVRWASSTKVKDAPSGFRAMKLPEALQLNVYNGFTYTIETIIQAGHHGMRITNVDVDVNDDLRASRLVRSIPSYVMRNMLTILRYFVIYKPIRFFFFIAAFPLFVALVLFGRFSLFYLLGDGGGKIQSLIIASAMLGFGALLLALGVIGDILSVNRRLLEKIQYNMIRNQLNEKGDQR